MLYLEYNFVSFGLSAKWQKDLVGREKTFLKFLISFHQNANLVHSVSLASESHRLRPLKAA